MARKTFFSFHFKRDVWRAGQVRNCNLIPSEDEFGFVDAADWETIERQGDSAIADWINKQLKDTSVTVVLIGAETSERDWVDYEIRKSWERGNGLVGIRIHGIKDNEQKTDLPGANPFDQIVLADGTQLSQIVKVYDWVTNDGRNNMGAWIEEAFDLRESYAGETELRDQKPNPKPPVSAISGMRPPTVIQNPSQPWVM